MTALRVFKAPQPGQMSITEAIDDFVEYLTVERNCPDTTIRAYCLDIRQMAEFLGNKPAMDVTMSDLRAWLEHLHGTMAPSSIGRKVACCRTYFRFGIREGWAKTNPAKQLDMPRRDQILPKVLSEQQITDLLDMAAPGRDRAMVEVMYAGGLRVSELVGLNLSDLDLEYGSVLVFGKGGSERVCPIGPQALDALVAYLDTRGVEPGPVFQNYRGGRLSTKSVRKIVGKLGNATPHTLRHSYATHLLNNGAGIRDVQELLGHKSIVSTQVYTHVSPERKKNIHKEHHPRG